MDSYINGTSLKKQDKVNLDAFWREKHKRFILSEEPLEIDGAVSLSMDYLDMDLYVNVPIGADVFKAHGVDLILFMVEQV